MSIYLSLSNSSTALAANDQTVNLNSEEYIWWGAQRTEPDQPPSGQSLFDELFHPLDGVTSGYDIPYPISKLIAKIEGEIGLTENSDANQIKSVLIPLGRCINRYAAAPDFFKSPRIVLAAQSEPQLSDRRNFIFLKDRLFIGYQKASAAMEVISYNDAAGRFEFQTVKNYDGISTPVVEYANREACISCHQNRGPIFSRAPWRETSANPQVMRRLAETEVIPKDWEATIRGSEAADIDSATNRANMFTLYQELWQSACDSESDGDAKRCRAGIFELVLQHRLRQYSQNTIYSDLSSQYSLPITESNIEKNWPQGIKTLSSDIVNPNPFVVGETEYLNSAADLTTPRTNLVNVVQWYQKILLHLVEGLGKFLPLADFRRLDGELFQLASHIQGRSYLHGKCQLRRTDDISELADGQTGEIFVNCQLGDGALTAPGHFTSDLYVESGKVFTYGGYDKMVLSTNTAYIGLTQHGGQISDQGDHWSLILDVYDSRHQLRSRLPNGGIFERVEIRWPKTGNTDRLFSSQSVVSGEGTITIISGEGTISAAINRMLTRADNGSLDLFSRKPFRGRQLMDELLNEIRTQ